MTLPVLAFDEPAEPYLAQSILQKTCDPKDKPGTNAFANFVVHYQGGVKGRISASCSPFGTSEHKEGRAFDWMISATKPDQAARAQELLDWLFANDGEMFRRAGLQYIIWNRRIWSVSNKKWVDYTGSSPHTDHIHFTFGWPGALGQTSFYRAINKQIEPLPNPPPVNLGEPLQEETSNYLSLLVGAALGWVVIRRFVRR